MTHLPSYPQKDVATGWLDEDVLLHEGILDLLLRRRETIRQEIERTEASTKAKRLRLTQLQNHLQQLMASQQKHIELRNDLQLSLEKNRWNKCPDSTGLEEGDDDDTNDEDDTNDDDDDDNNNDDDDTNVTMTTTSMDASCTIELRHKICISATMPSLTNLHWLREFWCYPKSMTTTKIHTFLPNQTPRIELIMNVITLGMLISDQIEPHGSHRRDAFLNTSLWIQDAHSAPLVTVDEPTTKNTIHSDLTLCPYELSGECADPYCPFQHLSPRNVQTMSREQWRLPGINLPPAPQFYQEDEQPRKRAKLHSILLPLDTVPKPVIQNQQANIKPTNIVDWKEENFISLPFATRDDDTEDDDHEQRNKWTTGNNSFPVSVPQHQLGFWWLGDAAISRIEKQDLSTLSFLEWLNVVFDIQLRSNVVETTKPSPSRLLLFCGQMIDAIRLCAYAGQLDIAAAVGDILIVSLDDHSQQAASSLAPLFQLVLELVLSLWKYQRYSMGPFLVIFKANLGFILVSECIRLVHASDNMSVSQPNYIAMFNSVQQTLETDSLERSEIRMRIEKLSGAVDSRDHIYILECCLAYKKGFGLLNSALSGHAVALQAFSQSDVPLAGLPQIITFTFTGMCAALMLAQPLSRAESFKCLNYLDYVSRSLSYLTSDCLLQTLLSPFYSFQVCALVQQRKYLQAQIYLETKLNDDASVMRFSEIFWCQYVQLRATLPLSPESPSVDQVSIDLPATIIAEHRAVAMRIQQLDVQCHHIVLPGDVDLFRQFGGKEKTRQSLQRWAEAVVQKASSPIPLDLAESTFSHGTIPSKLATREGRNQGVSLPRNILVGGWAISSLQLGNCQLLKLPLDFGKYFPNLNSLFLQRNALTVLPNSIGLLENIETLNISGNQLTSLPDTLRDCTELKYLDVSDNQLSHVRSLEHCQKLEKLNLEWNPLLEHPSYLVPLLRNLKEFIVDSSPIGSQQGQKRSARSMDSQSIPKTTIYMTPADCSHHANAEAGLVNSIGSKQDEEMSSQFLRSPNIPGTNNTATPAIVPNQVKIDPGVLLPSPMSSQEGQKLSFRSINSPIIPTSIKPSTLVDGSNHANIDPRVSPMISDIVATTGLTMKSQETTMDDQDVSGSTNAFSSFGTNLNRSKQGSTADPRNVSKYIFYPSGSTVNRLHHNSTK